MSQGRPESGCSLFKTIIRNSDTAFVEGPDSTTLLNRSSDRTIGAESVLTLCFSVVRCGGGGGEVSVWCGVVWCGVRLAYVKLLYSECPAQPASLYRETYSTVIQYKPRLTINLISSYQTLYYIVV